MLLGLQVLKVCRAQQVLPEPRVLLVQLALQVQLALKAYRELQALLERREFKAQQVTQVPERIIDRRGG